MEETSVSTTSRRFTLGTAAAWALTATAVIAILIAIPVTTIPFEHTKTLVLVLGAIVTLILFVIACLKQGRMPLPHLALVGSLWLVPLAYALSTLFSGVGYGAAFFGTGFSVDTFGLYLLLAVLATLSSLVLSTVPTQKLFVKGLGIAFALLLISELIFLIVGALAPSVVQSTSNLVGSFIDVGSMVGLIVILILLKVRFLPVAKNKVFVYIIALAIGLFTLALVNAVTTWVLVCLVAFGLFIESVMYRNRKEGNDNEPRPIGSPLATLIVGLLVLAGPFLAAFGGPTLGGALADVFGTAYIDARPSWQSTFAIGTHTYASSPLFGSGPGTFSEQWAEHHDRAINDSIFWNIDFPAGIGHVPTSFVTTGLIGMIAWIAFFAIILFFGVRALMRHLPTERFARFVTISSFVGALYVLALTVFALPGPVTLAIGFMLLGLFISSIATEERHVAFSANPRIGFAMVFILTILLLASIASAYVIVQRYAADLALRTAASALSTGDIPRAAMAVDSAIGLAPSDETYRIAVLVGLAQMNQIAGDATLAPTVAQQQFQAAVGNTIAAGREAARINPNDYQNWAILGNVYGTLVPLGVEGAYTEAKASYDRAVALAPMNPALHYILGQLEIANNNREAAEAHLIEAINLKRDYTQAIVLFSRVEIEAGKTAQALQAAEAAAYFAPNDPGVLLQAGLLRYAAGDTAGAIQALSRAVELNPQFANAHFFLGVMYAVSGDYANAVDELNIVAAFSPDNAAAVAADLAALQEGRNPFPTTRLATFGIPYAPVDEPTPAGIGTP